MIYLSKKSASRKGFTLLELLLAVTIMALISLAIFSVFSVATDSFKIGNQESKILQRGRYVMDTFEQDIMSVMYIPEETGYNVQATRATEEFLNELFEAQEEGDINDFIRQNNLDPDDRNTDINDPNNPNRPPFERFIYFDLSFTGEDNAETDRITFARWKDPELGGTYYPKGLSRVRYTVEGDFLIRTEETVLDNQPKVDLNTLEIIREEKEIKPNHVILARGITEFNISYGFWIDYTWFEIDSWESADKDLRDSLSLREQYDTEERLTDQFGDTIPEVGSQARYEYINDRKGVTPNGLPTYVRLEFKLTDPDNPGRETHFSRIFNVPGWSETWVPLPSLEEDQRDNELFIRQDEYEVVERDL